MLRQANYRITVANHKPALLVARLESWTENSFTIRIDRQGALALSFT